MNAACRFPSLFLSNAAHDGRLVVPAVPVDYRAVMVTVAGVDTNLDGFTAVPLLPQFSYAALVQHATPAIIFPSALCVPHCYGACCVLRFSGPCRVCGTEPAVEYISPASR